MKAPLKLWLFYALVVVVAVVLWRGGSLKSDAEMMTHFAAHRSEFEQVVAWFREDGRDMWIGRLPGRVWPQTLATDSELGAERVNAYRDLVARLGVSGFLGDAQGVEFQTHPWLSPFGPMKSYLYSTRTPETLTAGDTGEFVFAPGQWRRVCRPFEENWYICLDLED